MQQTYFTVIVLLAIRAHAVFPQGGDASTAIAGQEIRQGLPPRPVATPTDAIFRDAFIQVMEQDSRGWQLQPFRLGGIPSGEILPEEIRWRRGKDEAALVRYARYSTTDEASAALKQWREVVSAGSVVVKDFADEAFLTLGSRSIGFRRGLFVFWVQAAGPRLPTERLLTDRGQVLYVVPSPYVLRNGEAVILRPHVSAATHFSTLFLAAADRVLGNPIAR